MLRCRPVARCQPSRLIRRAMTPEHWLAEAWVGWLCGQRQVRPVPGSWICARYRRPWYRTVRSRDGRAVTVAARRCERRASPGRRRPRRGMAPTVGSGFIADHLHHPHYPALGTPLSACHSQDVIPGNAGHWTPRSSHAVVVRWRPARVHAIDLSRSPARALGVTRDGLRPPGTAERLPGQDELPLRRRCAPSQGRCSSPGDPRPYRGTACG